MPVHPHTKAAHQRLTSAAFSRPDRRVDLLPPSRALTARATYDELDDDAKRRIIRLSTEEGLSSLAIADALTITPSAVRKVLRAFLGTPAQCAEQTVRIFQRNGPRIARCVVRMATNEEKPSIKAAEVALKGGKILGAELSPAPAVQVVVNMPERDRSDTPAASRVMDAEAESG